MPGQLNKWNYGHFAGYSPFSHHPNPNPNLTYPNPRVTDKWNNLPQCCINCKTLNNFKSHIHKVLELETE